MTDALCEQVERLEAVFRSVAATRMKGIPLLHCGLRVEAVGFAPEPDGVMASGVLVTPWFMNLLRLPLGTVPESLLEPGATGCVQMGACLLYTSPSPRDRTRSRMPSSA